MTRKGNVENILAAVFLLQQKPRTSPELQKLLGLHETTILTYLRKMEAEGLIERSGERIHNPGITVGRKSIVWEWARVEQDQAATVDGVVIRVIVPKLYSLIDRLLDAARVADKALVIEAGRILPAGYRNSFTKEGKAA